MIFTLQEVDKVNSSIQNCYNIGITSGCFDLCHHLHVDYLERCRRKCDCLIVGVDSDSLIKSTKGSNRPIISEFDRAKVVNAIKYVDFVFIMDSMIDFLSCITTIKPKFIFKNNNFKQEEVLGHDLAEVIIIPDIDIIRSTTDIIKKVNQRR